MDKEKLEIENEELRKLLKDREDQIVELEKRLLIKEYPQKSEEDEKLLIGLMEGYVDAKSFFMQVLTATAVDSLGLVITGISSTAIIPIIARDNIDSARVNAFLLLIINNSCIG